MNTIVIDDLVLSYGGSFENYYDEELCGSDAVMSIYIHTCWIHLEDTASRGVCEHYNK